MEATVVEAGEAQDFAAWVQPHLAAVTRLAAPRPVTIELHRE